MREILVKDKPKAACAPDSFRSLRAQDCEWRADRNVQTITVKAASFLGNKIGEPLHREALVVLPEDYETSGTRRYPVLYLLHGFGHNAAGYRFWLDQGYARRLNVVKAVRKLEKMNGFCPMIVVCPDGGNSLGGSMWEDSPVSGGAAEFVVKELVPGIDHQFRTYACPEFRGIAGHSMGGQGAMKIAVTHPGIFGAVYSMSGMMSFNPDELLKYGIHWLQVSSRGAACNPRNLDEMSSAYLAMCTAYCWNPDRPPYYVDFPVQRNGNSMELNRENAARFFAGWPQPIAESCPDTLRSLKALRMDVGIQDEFQWGLESNRQFVRMLQSFGVPFSYEEYPGTHSSNLGERLEYSVLPFFCALFGQLEASGHES